MLLSTEKFLNLTTNRWFCAECGHSESASSHGKEEDKQILEREKQKLLAEFDEIVKKMSSFDVNNRQSIWNIHNRTKELTEWRAKLLIVLDVIK